ncbi:hypothetical protein RI845_16660 [Thalassotalea nanhaiensis]|uniref:MSHA biogenesis protein MshI n=1 Tax=Thalassotalea nanhaiensis TaxID=3065648 RepID=A0ABY9TH48_9GAMM|nr:hypothetical protein RI845_16660 [Colwelliaceae bacterium SQ345]
MLNGLKTLFNKKSTNSKFGIALRGQAGSYAFDKTEINEVKAGEFFTETSESAGEWLEELLSTHDFQGSGHLVLSASHYYNVQINKPDLPDNEIPAAIKWLVKDIVPIDPDEMIADYYDSPIIVSGTQKINVVCSHLTSLKKYTDSFKRYQIDLEGIITDEFAFANLLPVSEHSTLLVCQQPFEELFIIIVKEGQIHFSRRLRGFSDIGGFSTEQLNKGVCDSLSIEVQKSLDYFERLLKQTPVKEIKILLPVKHEDFIIENLDKNTNVQVSKLDLPAQFEQMRSCAASVGALIEFERKGAEND